MGSKILGMVRMSLAGAIMKSDGVICTTPEVVEPESFAAFRDWFSEMGKSVHVIGPLIPHIKSSAAVAGEVKQSMNGNEIEAFLEKRLHSHGEKSMLYISFGSIFWSLEPEKIWTFLDVIMEKKIPFIMSHGSPDASVPDDVATKVKAYGYGLLSQWSPQQTILSHRVTGWFVSHCGQNSLLEAIITGVPLICWPFASDQGTNAAHLTVNLGLGYELFEVRTGPGLRPVHRLGKAPVGTLEAVREEASATLDKAFGEDGKAKRANVEKLRECVLNAWEEGGPSRGELQAFVDADMA